LPIRKLNYIAKMTKASFGTMNFEKVAHEPKNYFDQPIQSTSFRNN